MPIKYIYLFIFFTSCIWAGQAQVEKELLLTFKQGGNELDIAAKNKIEKTLQSFAPNTPIEVVFYQDASALQNGQFNAVQMNPKNQAIIAFLKEKKVKIKMVRKEGVEANESDNPNVISLVLSGNPDIPTNSYVGTDSPRSGLSTAILPQAQTEKPEPSAGEEFFPSEDTQITFERAAELFLAPFQKAKKMRPVYH